MGISDDIRPVEKKKNELPSVRHTFEPKGNFDIPKQPPAVSKINKEKRKELEEEFFSFKNNSPKETESDEEKPRLLTKIFNKKTLIVFAAILLLAVVAVNYKTIKSLIKPSILKNSDKIAQYEGEIIPQDYTSGYSEDDSDSTSDSSDASSSTSSDSAVSSQTIDKASIKVSVLNGNGVRGEASQIHDILVAGGFSVPNVSNARKFSYQNTIIYYRPGFRAYADEVKSLLTNKIADLTESSDLTTSYEVVVVVGKN